MNTKKIWTAIHGVRLAGAAAAVVASAVPSLAAQASDANAIFDRSCSMLMTIKTWLFGVVYVLGAIGLVLIAVSAFLGRFKFAHLISLGGGLFIVAMADLLIDFLVSEGTDTSEECTG